jgi:hypothetical protein
MGSYGLLRKTQEADEAAPVAAREVDLLDKGNDSATNVQTEPDAATPARVVTVEQAVKLLSQAPDEEQRRAILRSLQPLGNQFVAQVVSLYTAKSQAQPQAQEETETVQAQATNTDTTTVPDDIKALNLEPQAEQAAVSLRQASPGVIFTSGRRSLADQARAMASNVVGGGGKNWVTNTYAHSAVRDAIQAWINKNWSQVKSNREAVANGILEILNANVPASYSFSRHLTGLAFDVQPGSTTEKAINALHGHFIKNEGGLVRWHIDFNASSSSAPAHHDAPVQRSVETASTEQTEANSAKADESPQAEVAHHDEPAPAENQAPVQRLVETASTEQTEAEAVKANEPPQVEVLPEPDAAKLETAQVQLEDALEQGERNVNILTDIFFFSIYPTLCGQTLAAGSVPAERWVSFRDKYVQPTLEEFLASSTEVEATQHTPDSLAQTQSKNTLLANQLKAAQKKASVNTANKKPSVQRLAKTTSSDSAAAKPTKRKRSSNTTTNN